MVGRMNACFGMSSRRVRGRKKLEREDDIPYEFVED